MDFSRKKPPKNQNGPLGEIKKGRQVSETGTKIWIFKEHFEVDGFDEYFFIYFPIFCENVDN